MEYHFGGKLTGCQLADILNSINPKFKMVFVTGYHDILKNRLGLEIIIKPITLTHLLRLVQRYIE
jgi:hypothetical protein